jgi:SAM-dependent methyltransferase
MDKSDQTVNTYDQSAVGFAAKFDAIGVRKEDIAKVFSLFEEPSKVKVLELGCGNGRDASDIIKYTQDYIGIDAAPGLITIAKENVPNTQFVVSDFLGYEYPEGADIIFAFASLIHLDKADLGKVFLKAHKCLNQNGIFRLSLKGGEYREVTSADELGERTYFLYQLQDILDFSDNIFELVANDEKEYLHDDWLELTLRKR